MADTNKLVTIALVGVGAYLAYEWFFATPAAASGTSGAVPPAQTPTMPNLTGSSVGTTPQPANPTPTPAPPAAQSPYNSLAAIGIRLAAQVQSNSSDPAITQKQGQTFATPSVFNYYLGQVSNYALDGTGMAAAFPGGDVQMSLPAFWSAASQYLAQAKGLSGYRRRA